VKPVFGGFRPPDLRLGSNSLNSDSNGTLKALKKNRVGLNFSLNSCLNPPEEKTERSQFFQFENSN